MQRVESANNKTVILLQDRHIPWHAHGNERAAEPVVYARGYATHAGSFFEDQHLARHIHDLAMSGKQALEAEIPNLNGGWAFVVRWPRGEILAAVDRLRAVPLFYYRDQQHFAIAACGTELAQRYSRPIHRAAELEFLLFRYVTGSETLYEGVRQLQPGEMIWHHPEQTADCAVTRYYRFYPSDTATEEPAVLANQLSAVIERMFERFRDGLRGSRVVIPLSGGLDSRLVAGMLKRVGVKDCLCFSYGYGDESARDVQIASQVAEALGYPWRFVSYSPDVWARLYSSGAFSEFIRYGCKGVSNPNLHDFPAVIQFAEEGLHGPDTVFFPGHSADMNAGKHIPSDYADILAGRISPEAHIVRTHGRGLWDNPRPLLDAAARHGLSEKTVGLSSKPPGAALEDAVARCEMWNAEQRQAKYLINSVRTYEFVGSRWRTLWDYEFMDFFLRVPIELRYGERLYLDCLRERIFVGDLSKLAEIPLAKHGPLKSLASVGRPAKRKSALSSWIEGMKRQTRRQLLKVGVARRHLAKADSNQFVRILLEGFGVPDGRVTFRETLAQVGAFEYLTPEAQETLKPWLNFNLDSLRLAGVYSTIVLAEMEKYIQSHEYKGRG
ncbi:MAG: asparagine synthase-related protein [Pirellulales bacterium]